jgi:hypothetical protein
MVGHLVAKLDTYWAAQRVLRLVGNWVVKTAAWMVDWRAASTAEQLVHLSVVLTADCWVSLKAESWVDLRAVSKAVSWAGSMAVVWVGWTAVARAAPRVALMAVPSVECWAGVWAARWAELTVCSTAGNLAAPKDVMTAVWKAVLKVEMTAE